MNLPAGLFVGTAHRSTIRVLHDVSIPVYAESLFDAQVVNWIKSDATRYALDEITEDSVRFARMLSQFRFTRHARVVGGG